MTATVKVPHLVDAHIFSRVEVMAAETKKLDAPLEGSGVMGLASLVDPAADMASKSLFPEPAAKTPICHQERNGMGKGICIT